MPIPIYTPPAIVMPAVVRGGVERPIRLSNKTWQIILSPEDLRIDALVPHQKEPVHISEPLPNLLLVASLSRTKDKVVQWTYLEPKITVRVLLEGDTLDIQINSAEVGEWVFPKIGSQEGLRGYALPFGEGAYIPSKDQVWRKNLIKREAFSTTEGFSFPAWGLDFGRFGLTYLLTSPYNNEFQFQEQGGRLFGSLTHQFTNN